MNGNISDRYSDYTNCVQSEPRSFTPAGETLLRMSDLADECITISEVLTHALFSIDQDKPVSPTCNCFADLLEGTAGKVARINANLLVLADRFGIQI